MVSVCLPSDALLQYVPSCLGFSYHGHGVSLHRCSSKARPLLLTLEEGYLLKVTPAPCSCHSSTYHIVELLCSTVHFNSVAQSCLSLWDTMNRSTPGLPVYHQLPESTQTHVHLVGDAIQPSHPLSSTSPSAFNLSQHQGLFKWVSSLRQVAKELEFQIQHQSLQWTPKTNIL